VIQNDHTPPVTPPLALDRVYAAHCIDEWAQWVTGTSGEEGGGTPGPASRSGMRDDVVLEDEDMDLVGREVER
jgi:hypothetical protein